MGNLETKQCRFQPPFHKGTVTEIGFMIVKQTSSVSHAPFTPHDCCLAPVQLYRLAY